MSNADNQPSEEFQNLVKTYGEMASAGRHEQAEAVALQMLALAAEAASTNPTPDMQLFAEALQCEDAGDLDGAEAARRKLVALRETELRQAQESRGESGAPGSEAAPGSDDFRYFALLTKAHLSLSAFQLRIGKLDQAWTSALAATAAARRCELSIVLRMALEQEAECALARQDFSRALAAATEAVQVIEPGEIHEMSRAFVLVLRARCLVATADFPNAEADLAASWELLSSRSKSLMMAGIQNGIAKWWEVTAAVRAGKGDLKGAVKAWQQAVEKRRHVAQLPQVCSPGAMKAVKVALKNLSDALQRVGDEKGAKRALVEAEAVSP